MVTSPEDDGPAGGMASNVAEVVVPDTIEQEGAQAAQVESDSIDSLDADLAATLGKPKQTAVPTGKLGSVMAGKSMFATQVEEKVALEAGEVDLEHTTKLKSDYDEAKVRSAWKALVEEMRKRNKMGLAATLSTGKLDFEDPMLHLTVSNQVQFDELKESATELLHFIRVTVGNGTIGFEVEVAEDTPAPEFLTPKDRYKRWAGENPSLETLRKRLDLDIG